MDFFSIFLILVWTQMQSWHLLYSGTVTSQLVYLLREEIILLFVLNLALAGVI